MTSDEVTGLCPVTGQPDFYTVVIRYIPRALCIESKSLKLFLQRYRDRGAFCETLAVEIAQAVMVFARPASVIVSVTQKSRGGIAIESSHEIYDQEWKGGQEWQIVS